MNATALGERVQARAKALNLKQADFVRATGVSRPTANAWWHGHIKQLKGDNLMKLAGLLKCNPQWLASGTGAIDPGESTAPTSSAVERVVSYSSGSTAKVVGLDDPVISEIVSLLKGLDQADKKEALSWLRGFAMGRQREIADSANFRVS